MRRNSDDPFDDIFREIQRMMNDVMGMQGEPMEFGDNMSTDTHVDIHEYDEEILVIADLPGVEKSAIDLQCDGRTLAISATGENRRYEERVRLPSPVDETSATARYNNGILEVTLERLDDSAQISIE